MFEKSPRSKESTLLEGLRNRGFTVVQVGGDIRDGDATYRVTGPGGNTEVLTLDEGFGLVCSIAYDEAMAKMERMDRLNNQAIRQRRGDEPATTRRVAHSSRRGAERKGGQP
jgi:hypothetical protein